MLTLKYFLLAFLALIIFFAWPRFCFKSHNIFEIIHRFAGWSAIAVFWAEAMLLNNHVRRLNGTFIWPRALALAPAWLSSSKRLERPLAESFGLRQQPSKTCGQVIHNSVMQSNPQAVVVDTRLSGRLGMIATTYNVLVESGAEAVFRISVDQRK